MEKVAEKKAIMFPETGSSWGASIKFQVARNFGTSRTFAHVDPVKTPIPVVPTCHYMMAGSLQQFQARD